MISTRYVPVICVLLAVALVPTVIHTYAADPWTDGRATSAIPSTLNGFTGLASDRHPGWGQRRFGSDDWIERTYARDRRDIRLTVVRSYDAKTLYHHPELAIAYGHSFAGLNTVRVDARPEVPVHALVPNVSERARAAYVLHYDDRFVDNPILFQLRTAGELLFSPRKPMTIFFALSPDAEPDADDVTPALSAVLFAAIDEFLAQ